MLPNHVSKEYIEPDRADGGLKATAPLGFTGPLVLWPTNTAPAGWAICDGSLVNKADYPELWELLGDTYGTSTTTQFYLPDLRGRVAVGRDSGQTEFDTVGEAGGHKSLQAHTHGPSNIARYVGSGGQFKFDSASAGKDGNFISATDSAGAGNAQNLQPYRVLNYIIKT